MRAFLVTKLVLIAAIMGLMSWTLWIIWQAHVSDTEELATAPPGQTIQELRGQRSQPGWHVGYTELNGPEMDSGLGVNSAAMAIVQGTPFCLRKNGDWLAYAWGKIANPSWRDECDRCFTSIRNPRWWAGSLLHGDPLLVTSANAVSAVSLGGQPLVAVLGQPSFIASPAAAAALPYEDGAWRALVLDPPLQGTGEQGLDLLSADGQILLAGIDDPSGELRCYWLDGETWRMQALDTGCQQVYYLDLQAQAGTAYLAYSREGHAQLCWFPLPASRTLDVQRLDLGLATTISIDTAPDTLYAALYNSNTDELALASLAWPVIPASQCQACIVDTIALCYSVPQVVAYQGLPVLLYTRDRPIRSDPDDPNDVFDLITGRGKLLSAWTDQPRPGADAAWRIEQVDRVNGRAHYLEGFVTEAGMAVAYNCEWNGLKLSFYEAASDTP